MENEKIRVNMLGRFSIVLNGTELREEGTRSRKVWLLLAYMICNRDRMVSQAELIQLLWGEEGSANPQNALKTMFHRVRALLGPEGHDLIIRREGNYAWNKAVPMECDAEEFDRLCRAAAQEPQEEARMDRYQQAMDLYRGTFLPKFANELWAVPQATYYQNLYLESAHELLQLLEARDHKAEAVGLCRSALKVEPYWEELYQHLMRDLLDLGEHKEAIQVYEEMSALLQENFGVKPSEELRTLYREAVRTVNDRTIPMEVLLEQLRETEADAGALYCDYDFFRIVYHAAARALARSGDATHLVLLTIRGQREEALSKRSLERAMENLRDVVRLSLRRGDIFAQCSPSQYVVLLSQATFENSGMVCERVRKAFYRQHPHSPAALQYAVQPVEPSGEM